MGGDSSFVTFKQHALSGTYFYFSFLSLVSSAPQFNQEDKIISDAWDAFGGPVENVEKSESQSGSTMKKRTPFGKRSQYLPVMKALLKVMESKRFSPNDVNTLMILTRDLLKQLPNDQFNFGPNSWLGKVIDMGLPESGDIVVNINRIPHITTQWGTFLLSDVTIMTQEERNEFIPPIRTLINVLEDNNSNPERTNILLKQSMKLTELMSKM